MNSYIHELSDWPRFTWDQQKLASLLAAVRHRQGRLLGRMESLGFALRAEALLQTLTLDVLKSSEIEGEIFDKAQVRSSIARRLGMDIGTLAPTDRHVEGIVAMMLDATQHYSKPLTEKRLFGWHASLFPTGYSVLNKIKIGGWRKGTMRVVSGAYGRERVHFEAPAAKRLKQEMMGFLKWFNATNTTDAVLRAAIAHLWFITIHPFEDGNGRIARAIADMALTRAEQSPQRFYSMSAQIRLERKDYYALLEKAQKGTLDITEWLVWFLNCLNHAFESTETILANVFQKAQFWKTHAQTPLNDRQRIVLNRLLDGFEGKLTTSKWAKLTKCSQDTALRDIIDLADKNILIKDQAGGRSTHYSLTEIHDGA